MAARTEKTDQNLTSYKDFNVLKAETRIFNLISSLNQPDLEPDEIEKLNFKISSSITELVNSEFDRSKRMKILDDMNRFVNKSLENKTQESEYVLTGLQIAINMMKEMYDQ